MFKIKRAPGSQTDRRSEILTRPIPSLLVSMSVPTIIGMLVMVAYNLTDAFFVGLLKNRAMTASIGVVFSFMSFIQALGFLFGYGSGNAMSRHIGERNEAEARASSALGIAFAVVFGIAIALSVEAFRGPLAARIGGAASPELLGFTTRYLRVIGWSVPFSLYAITVYNQLRLCGSARLGMMGLLIGMLTNMALDPILMFGFGLGFIGAGYATLAGQIVGCAALTLLAKRDGTVSLSLKDAQISPSRAYHVLVGGLPNFSRQTITSLALILLNIAAADYGETLIAALTVSSRVFAPAYLVMIGWCQGFQPICAMNYGAGKTGRVRAAFRLTLAAATAFLIVADLFILLLAPEMARLLTSDPRVIREAAMILRFQALSVPLLGFLAISSMYLQNIGRYFWSMLVSVSRQGFFYIPLIYLFSAWWGKTGIMAAQPAADLLSVLVAALAMARFYGKREARRSGAVTVK